MIPPELRAKIRRLHFAEHWKVGTIAAELSLHHDTVQRAVEVQRIGINRRVPPSVVDPYKDFVRQVLEQHARLTATRIFAMVKDRGYPGSVVQLRRYVRTVRPQSKAEAYLRLNTLPGEQAQVDWGIFGKLRVGQAQRTLSCFVLVLSWSRAMYARFFLDQTLESFLRGHVRAFEALGGVPRGILYDNLKSVVLERRGDAIRFHPRILDLAGHYHFAPKPCAPYRGNEKGKVERTIRYLRDSFFAARSFASLDDLNAQLGRWIADTAHLRRVPGDGSDRLVHQALLEEERPRLLPLPEHPFETDLVLPVASGKTPYVRFDGNDYSIPHRLLKKPLTLVASEESVRVLDGATEVARHERSYDKRRTIEDPSHIAALAKQKRHASELRGRDLLKGACANAEAFVAALAQRGSYLSAETSRLLKLLERYGRRELDHALGEAMKRQALSAASVAHILDQRARKAGIAPPLESVIWKDPRVQNLRVTPHSLTDYDSLCKRGKDDDDESAG